MRDRGALAREVEGVWIENTYQFQFINTDERPHTYKLTVTGLPGLAVASGDTVDIPATSTQLVVVRMHAPITDLQKVAQGPHKIFVRIDSVSHPGVSVDEKATFFIPR